MKNDPRKTEPVKASQIGYVADELERFVAALRLAESIAKQQPEECLGIYYWTSAEVGLKRMSSFVKSADESRRQAQLGKPLAIGEFKPRSTANKPPKASEVKAKADSLTTKKTSKKAKR